MVRLYGTSSYDKVVMVRVVRGFSTVVSMKLSVVFMKFSVVFMILAVLVGGVACIQPAQDLGDSGADMPLDVGDFGISDADLDLAPDAPPDAPLDSPPDVPPDLDGALYRSSDGALAYYRLEDATQVDATATHENEIADYPLSVMVTQRSARFSPVTGQPGYAFSSSIVAALKGPAAKIRESGALTVEFWLLFDSRTTIPRPLFEFGDLRVDIRREDNEHTLSLKSATDAQGARTTMALAKYVLPTYDMTHLVLTFDDRFFRVYAGGALVMSRRLSPGWVQGVMASAEDFVLNPDGLSHGQLAELALYDRALLAPEVARHALLGPLSSEPMRGSSTSEFVVTYRKTRTSDTSVSSFEHIAISPIEPPSLQWRVGNDFSFLFSFPALRIGPFSPSSLVASLTISSGALGSDGPLVTTSFWEVKTGWDRSASWSKPWSDGPREDVDLVPLGVYEADVSRLRFSGRISMDITDLVLRWLADAATNHGIYFKTDANRGEFYPLSNSARAPSIVVHGKSLARQPLSMGAAQVGFSAALGLSVSFDTDLEPFETYEVYADESLVCTTSERVCVAPAQVPPGKVEVFVTNAFGDIGDALTVSGSL